MLYRVIDKIQNYYGYAIRGSNGKDSMKTVIMAILKHIVMDDTLALEKQHSNCPRDRWCRYWNNPANYDEKGRLPAVFHKLLLPIFNRLSDDELLNRCQFG